jgi:hypothetical protein
MSRTSIKISGLVFILLLFKVDFVSAQVIWDRAHIDSIRQNQPASDTPIGIALTNLKNAAEEAVVKPLYSVTHKEVVPPSGDIHDYLSYSRYWWPDPDKPNGLPYIRKDGVVNREMVAKGDRIRLGDLCNDVQRLALAGYVLKEPRYSQRAAMMVRAWFLDEATKMNPNLNFGQGVPGREDGRGPGIIDTRDFMLVLDSVELFDETIWSEEDQNGLKTWFGEFQNWLKESPLGQHEQRAVNNHGSWYAAQRARYALFAGQEDVAKEIVNQAKKRIAMQFDESGNQAAELKRTLSLHYSLFNITALSRLARVGDKVEVDLWAHVSEQAYGIQKALQDLLPYMTGDSEWQHTQIKDLTLSKSSHLTLRLFSNHFQDESYSKVAEKMKARYPEYDFSSVVVGSN